MHNSLFTPEPLQAMLYLGMAGTLTVGFLYLYIPWLLRKRTEHDRWLTGLASSYRRAFTYSTFDHATNYEQTIELLELNERLRESALATQAALQATTTVASPAPTAVSATAEAATSTVTPPPVTVPPSTSRIPQLDLSQLEPRTTAKPTVPDPTGPPTFEAGEPESLAEFESQGPIVAYCSAMLRAMMPGQASIAPIVFTGPAGTGKTALMKALANSLRLRNLQAGLGETDYLELFPADIGDRADLERVLKRASVRPSVLRIDELHTIDREHAVLLYELLANGSYRFTGDTQMTRMPHVTVIAATTDWSLLHEALRRRFEQMAFEPLTAPEIVSAIRRRPFPIAEPAVQELVTRTAHAGVLWEALRYFKQGETFARADGALEITEAHMEQVYNLNALDRFGLTALDRRVIQVMLRMPRMRRGRESDELVAFGGAELQITQVAQVDLGTYRQIIKPKLLARGLLTTRPPYGQVLTDRAISLYQGQLM